MPDEKRQEMLTHHDIVKKLIGPIRPVGDSGVDEERHKNLCDLISLVDRLLFDIADITWFADRTEASMRKCGAVARKFMKGVKDA